MAISTPVLQASVVLLASLGIGVYFHGIDPLTLGIFADNKFNDKSLFPIFNYIVENEGYVSSAFDIVSEEGPSNFFHGVATRDIERGDVLARLPQRTWFHYRACEGDPRLEKVRVLAQSQRSKLLASDLHAICFLLKYEDDYVQKYLKSAPHQFDRPEFWGDLRILDGAERMETLMSHLQSLGNATRAVDYAFGNLNSPETHLTPAFFRWLRAIVDSRRVPLPPHPKLKNLRSAILPGIDLLRERPYTSSVRIEELPDGQLVAVVSAERSYKAGEEVFLTRRLELDNMHMLMKYGYTIDENVHDNVTLRFAKDAKVSSELLDGMRAIKDATGHYVINIPCVHAKRFLQDMKKVDSAEGCRVYRDFSRLMSRRLKEYRLTVTEGAKLRDQLRSGYDWNNNQNSRRHALALDILVPEQRAFLEVAGWLLHAMTSVCPPEYLPNGKL